MTGRARFDGMRAAVCAFAMLVLAGCADPGPQTHLNWPVATYYTVVVRPGDRVGDIAARYDVSSATVLRMNDLQARSEIYPGEILRIPPGNRETREVVMHEASGSRIYATPHTQDRVTTEPLRPVREARNAPPVRPQSAPPQQQAPEQVETSQHVSGSGFIWPVNGTVIDSFGGMASGERNDGINIAAKLGAPIRASQSGTISYAGNELRSYGNLILIKHDGGYITAYAHAQSIAVTKGQHVEQGQIIGTAGTTGDVTQPQVHFEIRRDSRPVDPKPLLVASR
jgi:murein DD-endopeptidase MepM/ murein hydrolase activator NlpD